MKEITFKVKKVTVLLNRHTDLILLEVDLPTAFSKCGYETVLKLDAAYNEGINWCKNNLKIDPVIVNTRIEKHE